MLHMEEMSKDLILGARGFLLAFPERDFSVSPILEVSPKGHRPAL